MASWHTSGESVSDAAAWVAVITAMLMWRWRSSEQHGAHLGAARPELQRITPQPAWLIEAGARQEWDRPLTQHPDHVISNTYCICAFNCLNNQNFPNPGTTLHSQVLLCSLSIQDKSFFSPEHFQNWVYIVCKKCFRWAAMTFFSSKPRQELCPSAEMKTQITPKSEM